MAVSLSILSLGSIFLGYFAKDLFVGLGTDFWNHSILILPEHNNQLEAEFFGLPNFSDQKCNLFEIQHIVNVELNSYLFFQVYSQWLWFVFVFHIQFKMYTKKTIF